MKAIPFSALLLSLCVTAFPVIVHAQGEDVDPPEAETSDSRGNPRFWQATLSGGSVMVQLDRITSVTKHQYLLEGAVVVTEVTVDTIGQALIRFYHLAPPGEGSELSTPARVIDRGRELLDVAGQRAGMSVSDMVVKKYPDTTHARSIEYRVADSTQLDALFESVKKSWESGNGRKIQVQ